MANSSDHPTARRAFTGYDIGLMATGLLVFFFSFLPWIGFNAGFIDLSANAWRIGFLAWFPVLLCMAVGGVAAARAVPGFRLPANMKVGVNLLLLLVSALAVVWLVIRTVTFLMESGNGGGTRVGLFLVLAAAIVQLVCAARAFKASGERAPSLHLPADSA
jgi:hypothetical protein